MKEIKKQFSISEYNTGKYKVKYTDGNYQYDARILCTDLNDELQPIVAAVDFLNKENLKKFSSDGEELYYDNDNNNNNNNHLFLLFNKFEDGDIVTNYDDGTISIFKSYREDEDEYDSYVEVDIKNKEVNYYDEISYIGFSCLSTEEEKKILNIAILKDNKKWDIYRTVCVNINNQADYFTSSIANTIVNEMFPITMPYTPVNGQYRVFVEYFKSNKNKDYDYDTYKFLYLITPEGNKVDLNMFKYEKDGILYDITEEEYEERKRNKVK